ncbi:MAG: hypothetical protein ACLFV8_02140, partial [Alphaproteobacteria bacterium]
MTRRGNERGETSQAAWVLTLLSSLLKNLAKTAFALGGIIFLVHIGEFAVRAYGLHWPPGQYDFLEIGLATAGAGVCLYLLSWAV